MHRCCAKCSTKPRGTAEHPALCTGVVPNAAQSPVALLNTQPSRPCITAGVH
jgi:hypothetical protein